MTDIEPPEAFAARLHPCDCLPCRPSVNKPESCYCTNPPGQCPEHTCHQCRRRPALISALAQRDAAVREEALEEAAAAKCDGCRLSQPMESERVHNTGMSCQSVEIRALIGKEPPHAT